MADLKVIRGNNRQIDLLAVNQQTGDQYHVEVSVTHRQNWCPTPEDLVADFEKKYFGVPEKREGKNTDYALGKTYEKQIKETYKSVGLDPTKIRRVWVCWTVLEANELDDTLSKYYAKRSLPKGSIEVLSFRDTIIPTLMKQVSTSNYEDDALRTLSLLQQYEQQTGS